jgi:hypothetical protein
MLCVYSVKELQDLLGVNISGSHEGIDAMSWLVVFISSFVPIVLLFVLLITDWLHGEPRSKLSSLRLWGWMKEKNRWDGFADSTRYAAIPLWASPSKTRMR